MEKKKKSRILTYFLSFLPGLGFMYRGFMKRGFSYLVCFLGSISFIQWLGISTLWLLPTLIWFYAFFDQINTFSLSEQESKEIKDDTIFTKLFDYIEMKKIMGCHKLIGGILLVLGGTLLCRSMYFALLSLLPSFLAIPLGNLMSFAPQLILSALIFYGGICMIQGKNIDWSIFHSDKNTRTLSESEKQKVIQSNVVYYMDKHTEKAETTIQEQQNIKDENEVLHEVSREQLIDRAKELLDNDVYQNIHKS